MEKDNLDLADRRILTELDLNCRQPATIIARKLRMNKNTVNFRIQRLEKTGIIKHYYTVIDSAALGYTTYRIMLRLQYATPLVEKKILGYICSFPEAWWVGKSHGTWDVGILIWAKTSDQLVLFWNKLNERFKEHIAEYYTTIYVKLWQFPIPFLKEKPEQHITTGDAPLQHIDEEDQKLLTYLSTRARDSVLAIAQGTGLTPTQVTYRMKQLQKQHIIKAYKAAADFNKLGFAYKKSYFILKSNERLAEMKEYAKRLPQTIYLDENIGIDFEPNFLVRSDQEFAEIIDSIKTRFGNAIRSHDVITYTNIVKIAYVPSW